jgi:hypothetical protein
MHSARHRRIASSMNSPVLCAAGRVNIVTECDMTIAGVLWMASRLRADEGTLMPTGQTSRRIINTKSTLVV